jgi:hypothetical protein
MRKEWSFEILSWIFIVLFAAMIVFPVYIKCGSNFMFYTRNAFAVIIFLALTRYLFLLKFIPYGRSNWWRAMMIIACIPLFLYSLDTLFDFKRFIDEEGVVSFFKGSTDLSDYEFGKYIRYEYIFFAVGALVTIAMMPIRMIVSFWRTTNTNEGV